MDVHIRTPEIPHFREPASPIPIQRQFQFISHVPNPHVGKPVCSGFRIQSFRSWHTLDFSGGDKTS